MELLGSCDGLLWRLVFDESVAKQMSFYFCNSTEGIVPFRHALIVDWHEEAIFLDFSCLVQLLHQEFHQLRFAVFRDHWQSVDNHECIKTLFESDVVLFLEIWRGD